MLQSLFICYCAYAASCAQLCACCSPCLQASNDVLAGFLLSRLTKRVALMKAQTSAPVPRPLGPSNSITDAPVRAPTSRTAPSKRSAAPSKAVGAKSQAGSAGPTIADDDDAGLASGIAWTI